MIQISIKNLKKGEFFRLKNDENAPLWVRSEYNRTDKKYESYKYDDTNHFIYCKSDRKVFI